jgi:hypothetical protein
MEVCYWALLFMPLVILRHLLNVFVQLANKRGFKQKFNGVLHQSFPLACVSVCLFPLIVARQRLAKLIPSATNTRISRIFEHVVFWAVRVYLKNVFGLCFPCSPPNGNIGNFALHYVASKYGDLALLVGGVSDETVK